VSADAIHERLDRLVDLYDAVRARSGESSLADDLGPPATTAELDRIEAHLGLLLPDEVRALYRWHNGVKIWLVPALGFNSLARAVDMWELYTDIGELPLPSNSPINVGVGTVLPVFDIDTVQLCVICAPEKKAVSPLVLVYLEDDQLTVVAASIVDFVSYLIAKLEEGWTGAYDEDPDALTFPKAMTPLGDAAHLAWPE